MVLASITPRSVAVETTRLTVNHFDTKTVELEIGTGERPLVFNRERAGHWTVKHEAVKQWRKAAWVVGNESGVKLARATLAVRPDYPKGPLPDTGGIAPVEKAIVDGLVDAGVLPADTGDHLAGVLSLPPRLDGSLGFPVVRVGVYARDAVSGHGLGECGCR